MTGADPVVSEYWSGVETSPLWSLKNSPVPLGEKAKQVRALLLASNSTSETPRTITVTSQPSTRGYIDGNGKFFFLYPDGVPQATTWRDVKPGDGTVSLE